MPTIINGNSIAQSLRDKITRVAAAAGVTPGLATVLVGSDPASQSYVRSKQRACERAGFKAEDVRLPEQTSQAELEAVVHTLNARADIHGVLIQQPLPSHLGTEAIVAAVLPEKDVDGFHPVNLGALVRGGPGFWPCTPFGILHMLAESSIPVCGKSVVIVGRSLLVGRPLALMLLQKGRGDATVTVCHSRTPDVSHWTRQADIVIAAMGRPGAITSEMVGEGAVVIDVGINRVDDPSAERGYRLVGDVAYEEVAKKAAAITPVPGGVGPMTVAMLLYNTLQAARGLRSQDPL